MTNWHCDDDPTPFYLRVYTRNNTFIHPDDLDSHHPPKHLDIYTLPSCTLGNLALLIAAERPETFPVPALGTRVAFQHIYLDPSAHDSSSSASLRSRYIARDLGNVVLGGSGIGALAASEDTDDDEDSPMAGQENSHGHKLPPLPVDEALKFETRTLKSLRFVPGDVIAVAVLPPMDDGHVAPMTTLRRDKGAADRDRNGWGVGRDRGGGSGAGREGRRSGGGGFDIPRGDWRRGDRLPEEPFTRAQRGRRRW